MEDTHRDHIAGEFEAIRAGIDTLSKCTVRVSVSLDTSGLHAALQDVLAEEDQHRNALATITSLEAAIQSEQRHDEAMLRLVGYLRSQRDDLASRAETADCP